MIDVSYALWKSVGHVEVTAPVNRKTTSYGAFEPSKILYYQLDVNLSINHGITVNKHLCAILRCSILEKHANTVCIHGVYTCCDIWGRKRTCGVRRRRMMMV